MYCKDIVHLSQALNLRVVFHFKRICYMKGWRRFEQKQSQEGILVLHSSMMTLEYLSAYNRALL